MNDLFNDVATIGVVILVIIAALSVSYLTTSGLVWVICFAFDQVFTWRLSLGVWAITLLISGAVKSVHSSK